MAAPLTAPAHVAVLGLGNMGAAVADRLLAGEYEVDVFNRTHERAEPFAERGATILAAATDAFAAADVCLTLLSDDAAVEQAVLDGVLAGGRPGKTLIEMSTISVSASQRVAERAAEAGVSYLRAPVSGNPAAIASGRAAIFVSGDAEAAARWEGLLHAIAGTVRYVGEGERARALKLVLQILIGGTAELLAEALALGERAGLDRATLLEVIGASVIGSTFVSYKTEPLLNDDYSATFTTRMLVKDLDLVLDLAREVDVALPLTEQLRALGDEACLGGYADQDFIALVRARRGDE